jgi:uncharacterized protein YecE (DUF72 family)
MVAGYNHPVAKSSKTEPMLNPTLFEMDEPGADPPSKLLVERPFYEPGVLLGTSAFTAAGWPGTFYPAGMKPTDYLTYYASRFMTVEIDSTFYRTPSSTTAARWHEQTPPDFMFALKIPRVVTHEKVLADCEGEFDEFIDHMSLLDEKLGPLLFQFPYFGSDSLGKNEFLRRLGSFLKRASQVPALKFAVEIRNKTWLVPS